MQWEPQYKFILDKDGNQIVDFIRRFEHFNYQVYTILDIINLYSKFLNILTEEIPHNKKVHFQTIRTIVMTSLWGLSNIYIKRILSC